jgi:prophage regulatory protein
MHTHDVAATDSLIAIDVVAARTGGRNPSTIRRDVKAGRFPAPVRVGGRLLWSAREVDEWIAARLAERDEAGQ